MQKINPSLVQESDFSIYCHCSSHIDVMNKLLVQKIMFHTGRVAKLGAGETFFVHYQGPVQWNYGDRLQKKKV